MNRHTTVIGSTGSALKGAKHGFAGRNFRIQLVVGAATLLLGYLLPLSINERFVLIFLVAVVLAAELFNSAIEELSDVIIHEHHPGIARVKEMAAAAVMILAIAALVIGLRIFLPYL